MAPSIAMQVAWTFSKTIRPAVTIFGKVGSLETDGWMDDRSIDSWELAIDAIGARSFQRASVDADSSVLPGIDSTDSQD
ncbi:hypothetical protein MPTK1_1g03760 [Marchantia polymorpha subsp. ruderalis]|uniref:Uncharacterized protein n=2 Tax=Marchantia polymorpha TaxID=3197 RepID=A0AAF6AL76_MARPO|nr:hypothetical protein MARPO_0005s0231 [Marchantia polymorpha]BBM97196.1 hypothetical protein Mp_1g03760 [Marchantia polymorpha subsp. ruderalis]|eukprot:PTQ48612.1 hypothetical protein MARPO_0005s0231 [Marchantia polymorpha]